MSDLLLFETQDEVTKEDCDIYAQNLLKSSLTPNWWQGCHSYTLLSDSKVIVQFRSKISPLNVSMATLAKKIHPHLAPATTYHGCMPNSSVTIWEMEAMPGIGFLATLENLTSAKQELIVIDFAKYYAASWNSPQAPARDIRQRYDTKLIQLSGTLPIQFTATIKNLRKRLDQIIDLVPGVLSHGDLSDMNILADPVSGHLTGIVDWAEATIEPFGTSLWGLQSVLGCIRDDGWSYHSEDTSRLRMLFQKTFLTEIGCAISGETREALNELKTLGTLLRYGFEWENGMQKTTDDITLLEVHLQGASNWTKNKLPQNSSIA